MKPLLTEADLENELSNPTPGVLETLRKVEGDFMVLGAGGKMGPTLARMLRRGLDSIGHSQRQVYAVSRFSSLVAKRCLQEHGVQTISCDLLNRAAVDALPDAANIIFMAGQKFGTDESPELTWVMNTLVPASVALRYAQSRIVVFSTGCVYPLTDVESGGSVETDSLGPPGDYANSCVGRERIFTHYALQNQTPMIMFRLSYAIDLRYGVIHDVAQKLLHDEPVDVTMGYANIIWQGDANARAIQCLCHVGTPPALLNVTGIERVSIRTLAEKLGSRMGKAPRIIGSESSTAWLFNAQRSYDWFGPPGTTLDEMIDATAQWVRHGGSSLGKPTHFETRDGHF